MADGSHANTYDEGLELTAAIVAAYLGNASHVQAAEIPELIRSVRQAMREGGSPPAAETGGEAQPETTAVTKAQARKSVTPDALISFIDNKPYKTLKRHLTRHGLDMKGYRQRYGLPAEYPSVAPNYSAARSEMARKLGLGARGRGGAAAASEPTVAKQAGKTRAKPAAE